MAVLLPLPKVTEGLSLLFVLYGVEGREEEVGQNQALAVLHTTTASLHKKEATIMSMEVLRKEGDDNDVVDEMDDYDSIDLVLDGGVSWQVGGLDEGDQWACLFPLTLLKDM